MPDGRKHFASSSTSRPSKPSKQSGSTQQLRHHFPATNIHVHRWVQMTCAQERVTKLWLGVCQAACPRGRRVQSRNGFSEPRLRESEEKTEIKRPINQMTRLYAKRYETKRTLNAGLNTCDRACHQALTSHPLLCSSSDSSERANRHDMSL